MSVVAFAPPPVACPEETSRLTPRLNKVGLQMGKFVRWRYSFEFSLRTSAMPNLFENHQIVRRIPILAIMTVE